MKQSKLQHIKYTRATNIGGSEGEVTERYIIPTSLPTTNIKAIDVTDLSESERETAEKLWAEYQEYYHNAVSVLFDFGDWISHTTPPEEGSTIADKLKWRTFKPENVEYLD